jgi:xanthine dehydrogenase accessory factor
MCRINAPLHLLCDLLGWHTIEIADANKLSIDPDEWTAAIVKSHNYGRDFVALQKLLPLDLHYVGLIGPRRRRDQLLNHLLDTGVTINAGFFAPAGLDLGGDAGRNRAGDCLGDSTRVCRRLRLFLA